MHRARADGTVISCKHPGLWHFLNFLLGLIAFLIQTDSSFSQGKPKDNSQACRHI